MTHPILEKLSTISDDDDLIDDLTDIVEQLRADQVGLDAVEPILRFIESHPTWHFGSPGPLVHFVEKFYKKGYEEELMKSLLRHPTTHTAWMLNRVINGTTEPDIQSQYLDVLREAAKNPLADKDAVDAIENFLLLH